MAYGVERIDWAAPWLDPWRSLGQTVAGQVLAGSSCAQALNVCQSSLCQSSEMIQSGKRFVAQAELPKGVAYEQHIFDTHSVPTRDGLHDFFNGLCWLQFPRTKTRLNQLQAAQIGELGVQPVRGSARDALTLFDENAALLQAPDALWQALCAKDWQRLFIDLRALWQEAQLILFGHALLEKLVQPRKAITAHVYRVLCPDRSLAAVDAWLAHDLSASKLAAKPYAHLPVLGVPQWCSANEASAFYADSTVFRAARPPS